MKQWLKNLLAVAIGVYIAAVACKVTDRITTAEAPDEKVIERVMEHCTGIRNASM